MTTYRAHPAAALFPMMTEGEIAVLAKDILNHGQVHPILVVDGGGGGEWLILDGRNRFEACRRAGVHPKSEVWSGKDPIAFVVSLNLTRRHLTESQRAMIAADIATMKNGSNRFQKVGSSRDEPTITAREEAAVMLDVSPASVDRARRVKKYGVPELAAVVAAGGVKVKTASVVAMLPEEEQRLLVANGPDAIIERARRREVEPSAPRLVMHNGGVSRETKPGVFQVPKQKLYDLSAQPNWRTRHEDHAAVLRLLEQGMRVSEIVEATGFEEHFVQHSMSPYRIRPKVMAKAIIDMQATAETWASWARRIDEKWPGASRAEKDELIKELEACRRSAGAFIRELKKDARTEGEAE